MEFNKLSEYLDPQIFKIYSRAHQTCDKIVSNSRSIISEYLMSKKIDDSNICFIAVGSVGRREALEASDLDLLPLVKEKKDTDIFKDHDVTLRGILAEKLKIKVSAGKELTELECLGELITPEKIGGKSDDTSHLTKRILILTEGIQIGGGYDLLTIKRRILDCYKKQTITSGRYILSLCNDIARYYRTLCLDYKSKIDFEEKDWCTRNIKLRHSRKVWYFSNVLTLVTLAYEKNDELKKYSEDLLEKLSYPPYLRIFDCLEHQQIILGNKLLKYYAWYLEFMSDGNNREKLSKIKHPDRYAFVVDNSNPYHLMKICSDVIHNLFIQIFETLDYQKRQKILDWFLL